MDYLIKNYFGFDICYLDLLNFEIDLFDMDYLFHIVKKSRKNMII